MSPRIAMYSAATLLATVGTSFGNPIQWPVAQGGNGHFYEVVSIAQGTSWTDAAALAEARGGHLATLTSAAESDFVFNNLVNDAVYWNSAGHGPWLGGFQDEKAPDFVEPAGGWRWVTDEPWDYSNWLVGRPDEFPPQSPENFLHYFNAGPIGTQWNDFPDDGGGGIISMVVEYPTDPNLPDCNANGIPDTIDIATGTSTDANANGFPDDCDVIASGACFLPNGACVQTTLANCFAAGGSWAGPFVACDAATPPDRCLGDVNFDGSVDFVDLIALLAAWGECL